MSFILSKIFAVFLFPYPLFLLLLFVFSFAVRQKWPRRFYRIIWLLVFILSTTAVSGPLLKSLENNYRYLSLKETPQADVIVVLSGMIKANATRDETPEFTGAADRILKGVELLKKNKAPRLLLTGGSGLMLQNGEAEAAVLGTYIRRMFDIKAEKILTETGSRNTYENAVESARLLMPENKKILLVTSAFHMPRSVRLFRAQGFKVVPVPVDYKTATENTFPESYAPSLHGAMQFTIWFKETVGTIAYSLMGRFE